jgi:hypothetical protein
MQLFVYNIAITLLKGYLYLTKGLINSAVTQNFADYKPIGHLVLAFSTIWCSHLPRSIWGFQMKAHASKKVLHFLLDERRAISA